MACIDAPVDFHRGFFCLLSGPSEPECVDLPHNNGTRVSARLVTLAWEVASVCPGSVVTAIQ